MSSGPSDILCVIYGKPYFPKLTHWLHIFCSRKSDISHLIKTICNCTGRENKIAKNHYLFPQNMASTYNCRLQLFCFGFFCYLNNYISHGRFHVYQEVVETDNIGNVPMSFDRPESQSAETSETSQPTGHNQVVPCSEGTKTKGIKPNFRTVNPRIMYNSSHQNCARHLWCPDSHSAFIDQGLALLTLS